MLRNSPCDSLIILQMGIRENKHQRAQEPRVGRGETEHPAHRQWPYGGHLRHPKRECNYGNQFNRNVYFISCSKSRKSSESKKFSMVIPSPSHSFLTVDIVVLLFRPLTMLFSVDWVTPLIELSLLMEISRSRHNSKIRSLTA